MADVDFDALKKRVDHFIVLKEEGYLSIAMLMDLMSGLAKSFGVREQVVLDTLNERYKVVNMDESFVDFVIVEKAEGN